ncbi:MAG: hypothetical protein JHD21_01855, partial [Nocardioides sp.]|nr:hypothetical protein [Nocardioides sp.]
MPPDPSPKLEIDWLKTAAGAFAAVSSAFLLSTLGAAGTIIGAALGSVIVTVGGALYTQALARSQQRLAQVQSVAMRKVGVAQADVRRAARRPGDDEAVEGDLAHADERLDEVKEELGAIADEPTGLGWPDRFVKLPWKRITLAAAGLFVAALLAITAFELIAGKSVSSLTGGSEGDGPTIGRIVGDSDEGTSDQDDQPPPKDEPSPSETSTGTPSEQPTPTDAPTDEPSPTPEPTTAVPTPTAPTT